MRRHRERQHADHLVYFLIDVLAVPRNDAVAGYTAAVQLPHGIPSWVGGFAAKGAKPEHCCG